MKWFNIFQGIVFFLILVCFLSTGLYATTVNDFTLMDVNNRPVSLSDYAGENIIIVTFWVGRCAPCMDIMVELDKIVSENDDVAALAINIDFPRMVDRSKSYFRSQRFSFPALFDNNMQVARMFNVTSSGHTFLIGFNREILYRHSGFNRGDEVKLIGEINRYREERTVNSEQ